MRRIFMLVLASLLLFSGCISTSEQQNESTNVTAPPTQPPQCSDGDGGKNISLKSTVTAGTVVRTDSCEGGFAVREYYCDGGYPSSELFACPAGDVCLDGACTQSQPENETLPTCADSDDGKDYAIPGSVTYDGEEHQDLCQGAYDMIEYYCEGDAVGQVAYHCQSGEQCIDGACIPLNRACSDTDSDDPLRKGTATQYGGGVVISTKTDYCLDNITRNEYYCEGSGIKNSSVACPAGTYCLTGACVPLCKDNDGEDEKKASSVSDAAGIHYDYCIDDLMLAEYICEGGKAATVSTSCGAFCLDGRCYDRSELTCRESGGNATLKAGDEVVETGNDTCLDYATAIDYRCISNRIEFFYEECGDDELCDKGDCKPINGTGCHDMDADEGDDDIFSASQVVLTTNDSIDRIKSDYCTNDAIVAEFYCEGEYVRTDFLSCPTDYRCEEGACIYPYTCIDSDGGQSLEPGHVSLIDNDVVFRTERDACSDDTHIREMFCKEDNTIGYAMLACPAGTTCDSVDGSCK
ncbi:hypothetical protein H0O00_04725 [Candidatus Micrarchaeota archaeon]|nr:hypothetical protein [Candidatus Micrarchaeota archaeon]